MICDALYDLLSAQPSTTVVRREAHEDWLIMGSDGFWDAFETTESLQQFIRDQKDLTGDLAQNLAAKARERMPLDAPRDRADDISVVAINLGQRLKDHEEGENIVRMATRRTLSLGQAN